MTLAAMAAPLLLAPALAPVPAYAVLDPEEDLTLPPEDAEDDVEDDECAQAWPVACSEGSGGSTGCGGWNLMRDLAEPETLPGDSYASCSTGIRLGMGAEQTQGQAVGSMFSGIVIFSQAGRSRDGRDYGGVVVVKLQLDDGSPQCFARYMFLDRRDLIRTGTEVKPGQRIGSVASDDMSPTKRWWRENWGSMPAQVKIDIGCDEALANLPHFMPKERYTGEGQEDMHSCPLTKIRFPAPPLVYLQDRMRLEIEQEDSGQTMYSCHVGVRKDARKGFRPAPPKDDSEFDMDVTGHYVETVKPRGVIKRKETPVFAVFGDPETRDNLFGANKNRGGGSLLFRDHTNYPQATTLRCENMNEIFRGRDGESLTPEVVRDLMNHCTNQYILGRSLFAKVFEQSAAVSSAMQKPLPYRLREFMEPEDRERYEELLGSDRTGRQVFQEMEKEIIGVYWRDLCQPLKTQRVRFKDYQVNELLTKSWNELLIDWPTEHDLTPINRRPIPRIDINSYADYPYERINDPSNPFSPRHIFAETERERYSNYNVQCAATPVDIILGTYGEEEPFKTYGLRDKSFHQCIRCRIEVNEGGDACFADPYSFETAGGCQGAGSSGSGICPDLDPAIREVLNELSVKFGLIPEFLEFILKRESSCASNAGTTGSCHTEVGGGGGRGIWQVDINFHPARVIDPNREIRLLPTGDTARAGTDGNNICDPMEGGEHAVSYIAHVASMFDCHPGFTAGGYNAGPYGVMRTHFRNNDLVGANASTTNNYVKEAMDLISKDNICLPGGPHPDGSGTGALPGSGSGSGGGFGLPDVLGTGSGGSGGLSGSSSRPSGIDMVKSALSFRGEPYSMGAGRDQLDSGVADCSGLMDKAYHNLTGTPLHRLTTQVGEWNTSTGIEKWAKARGGKRITREEAMNTPGAFMTINGESRGYTGMGAIGHIGISAGDGATAVETKSAEGAQVGCSPFDRNGWTDFFLFPDNVINYDPAVNRPVPGLCDMIMGRARGICRHALDVSTFDKEDLTPPSYFEEYEFPDVELPDPPSENRGDDFDLEVYGMVYEGAWTECDNLPGNLREVCVELNETEASEVDAPRGTQPNPSGGVGNLINPVPCHPRTSPYGPRWGRMHNGIDIGAPTGTPIFAAADGIVESLTPTSGSGGYGNFTVIRHPDGSVTRYAHQSQFCPQTRVGGTVVQGQVLGYVGNTGNSTGPHLHFEVMNPDFIDPKDAIPPQTPNDARCPEINSMRCGQTIDGLPVGAGIEGSGKMLCVDRPCTLRYDEADTVSQCAFPTDEGGCGTLGHFSQRNEGDNGDCCFKITAPVTPLNILKIRPGYDEEALRAHATEPDDFMMGAWDGIRPDDGLENGLKGEGGTVPVSAENPGAPEGYTFHEHFRNHRPYMRWWDTGAESGNILMETTDAESLGGSFDALVGVGVEQNNCGIGGWGTPEQLDGNSSWMELKLYQARSQYMNGLRCIARYEKVFKRGASEDYAHRLAGGNFDTSHTGLGSTGGASINWPIGWRGYASENEPAYRFPYYLNFPSNDISAHGAMVGGGLDYALPGDIIIWDKDVSENKRLQHVAYVVKANNLAINSLGSGPYDLTVKRWFPPPIRAEENPSVTVIDYNYGKYPDACGTTNWWAVGPERTLYKGEVPSNYEYIAERTEVHSLDCGNPDLTACSEKFWDQIKVYRPWKHVRQ